MLEERGGAVGATLGAPLISMLTSFSLAAAGVIPSDCTAYDVVWKTFLPMAASLYLLESDFLKLIDTGGPILGAFVIGAIGMIAGAVIGWKLVLQGIDHSHAIAASLCSSYVGGSINFVSVAAATKLSSALVPAAMAADNLMMALFLGLLSAFSSKGQSSPSETATESNDEKKSVSDNTEGSASVATLSLSFFIASASCALSQLIATKLDLSTLRLSIMAFISMALSALLTRVLRKPLSSNIFAGSGHFGSSLMLVFFAVIGAGAGDLSSLASCSQMSLFLLVMVAVHWAVTFGIGGMLQIPFRSLVLGSNCNIGGPATSAAMALSKGWGLKAAQASMLVGGLGYAVGTAAGIAVWTVSRML